MSQNLIPVTVSVAGQIVFTGNIQFALLSQVLTEASQIQSKSVSNIVHNSYPITPDQAEQLLRKIDKKSVSFLKAIAQNDGEIDFRTMQKIFGIKNWSEYSGSFGKGITRALRYMTDNSSAALVWWDDNEWKSVNDPDGSVYVDGEALKSLKIAVGTSVD